MSTIVRVTSKGDDWIIPIPAEIAEALGLEADMPVYVYKNDGSLIFSLRPQNTESDTDDAESAS